MTIPGSKKLRAHEGHNIQKRLVRAIDSESLENSESRYTNYQNFFTYPATEYGHPGPHATSFTTQHHGPYSHQYHNQFFDHHHHHHHSYDCHYDNSDNSESSSEETYTHGWNKPYPTGKVTPSLPPPTKPVLITTTPAPVQPVEPVIVPTTEPIFDIDKYLNIITVITKRPLFCLGSKKLRAHEGHNIQKRLVRAIDSESLENSESRYTNYQNFFTYPATEYGHPGPHATSFTTQHHGPYSHQYHNQFFDHHHHHHHSYDCHYDNSDNSESSSEETYTHGWNKPYPTGKVTPSLPPPTKPVLITTTPAPVQPVEPVIVPTTEPIFDIDKYLNIITVITKRPLFCLGSKKLRAHEGHNIQKRLVRAIDSESLENSESRYTNYQNFFTYPATEYGHPGPHATSFTTQHHGPYSHQYHNQFFDHHHHHHHHPHHHHHNGFPPGHYPHYNFDHHHSYDCHYDNSDNSESSSEETYTHGWNKPYPTGKVTPSLPPPTKPVLITTTPAPVQPVEPVIVPTTEPIFDIDVRLGKNN
ncbi:hypothetical protein FQR65_LT11560 [Abscondita terminalis]|nr:hypothetical protein FQR65_LT11560 [Abscondita terminalis]